MKESKRRRCSRMGFVCVTVPRIDCAMRLQQHNLTHTVLQSKMMLVDCCAFIQVSVSFTPLDCWHSFGHFLLTNTLKLRCDKSFQCLEYNMQTCLCFFLFYHMISCTQSIGTLNLSHFHFLSFMQMCQFLLFHFGIVYLNSNTNANQFRCFFVFIVDVVSLCLKRKWTDIAAKKPVEWW